jgi:type III secretion protein W
MNMSQRIDGPGANPAQTMGSHVQEAAQSGSFKGESVRVEQDALSLMADAAEELSFSASEDVERKLAERKEGKEKQRDIERILFYVDKSEDINRDDLEKLLKQLAALKNANSSQLLSLTRQAFKDPTNQHAALSYARANLSAAGLSPEATASLREAIDSALGELEQTEGRAINAGYNMAGVDAPGLGLPPSSLRVLYRDVVIDFESYEKTFSAMLQKFGTEEFPKAVNFLIRALGNDMSALTPSSASSALKEVMDGLYMVESLGTLHRDAGALLKGVEERHGQHGIAEKSVLEPLLRYKDIPMLLSRQISADMGFLVSDNAFRDAELTQGVRELARKMPHKLYSSPEARQNVLIAFQELLDEAVDREEAAMEE